MVNHRAGLRARDRRVYYNSAGCSMPTDLLGKYRRTTSRRPNQFWEKYFLQPATWATRSSRRARDDRVYICYDRHFPEARGSSACTAPRSVFHPSATVAASQYLWKHRAAGAAVANGYFMGSNRVGTGRLEHRKVLRDVLLRGSARQLSRTGSEDEGRAGRREMNLDLIEGSGPHLAFYRDRRPTATATWCAKLP